MPNKIIVQILGLPGSGKSEACHYLNKYGFSTILISDLIRKFAAQHNIELIDRKDYSRTRDLMLKTLGSDTITKTVLNAPSRLVCVDGIRVPRLMHDLSRHGAISIAFYC